MFKGKNDYFRPTCLNLDSDPLKKQDLSLVLSGNIPDYAV